MQSNHRWLSVTERKLKKESSPTSPLERKLFSLPSVLATTQMDQAPQPLVREKRQLQPRTRKQQRRILHFDIETRKVGFFSAGKFNPDGCEPVAIACSWADKEATRVFSQLVYPLRDMLDIFWSWWDKADMVTGHYIRKFDLPIINGVLLENKLPPLSPKLTSDTKLDLKKRGGIGASQENLADLMELEERKFGMSDSKWRRVARLEPEAMEDARTRVISDVKQHKALRRELCALGWMNPPKLWRP